jgi:hypothetical protein
VLLELLVTPLLKGELVLLLLCFGIGRACFVGLLVWFDVIVIVELGKMCLMREECSGMVCVWLLGKCMLGCDMLSICDEDVFKLCCVCIFYLYNI